jgi:predicted nucleic acid-binding Zn ribbon protein
MTMARTQPSQIKNIIQAAVHKARVQKQATALVGRAWQSAAGKGAAKHSRPIKLTRKTLVVSVDSSAWIYYLHNRKPQIEAVLNKLLAAQAVKIRLRAGDDSEQKNNNTTNKKQKRKDCAKKTN